MRKTEIVRAQNKRNGCDTGTRGKKVFLSLIVLILIVIFVFVVLRMSHQAKKQNGINEEISKFQLQINRLEGENQDLNELIGYLKTDDFKEKEAKDKLNLITEGEQMVLVKEGFLEEEGISKATEKETELVVHRENYYYWWHYFFSIK